MELSSHTQLLLAHMTCVSLPGQQALDRCRALENEVGVLRCAAQLLFYSLCAMYQSHEVG